MMEETTTKTTIRFRQFCFTHARSGIYGGKGWQAVGTSDMDFFKPLMPLIQTAIAIPESAQLQRLEEGYRIYGLRKIGQHPALIKITDAGKTSDNRPGNIFVHLLMPLEEDKPLFFSHDIFSVFSTWQGWKSTWEEGEDPKMGEKPIELMLDREISKDRYEEVLALLELHQIKPEYLALAGILAAQLKRPQYLLVQPATDQPEEQLFNLLSFLWTFMRTPEERKEVSLWMGRGETRYPGFNWIVLRKSAKSPIAPAMVDHVAYCFDFQQNQFSKPATFEKIIASGEPEPNTDLATQRLTASNLEKLRYQGSHPLISKELSAILKRFAKDHNLRRLFMQEEQTLRNAFDVLNKPIGTAAPVAAEEYLHAFRCLLQMAHLYATETGNSPKEFVKSAFELAFPQDFFRKHGEALEAEIENLLTNSFTWGLHFQEKPYQYFVKALCQGVAKLPHFKFEDYWIWKKAIVEAEKDGGWFGFFRALLRSDVESLHLLKYFQQIYKEQPGNWLVSSIPQPDEIPAHLLWYQKFGRVAILQGAINRLPPLLEEVADDLQNDLFFALARHLQAQAQPAQGISFWRKTWLLKNDPAVLEAYFQAVKQFKNFNGRMADDETLLLGFGETQDVNKLVRELKMRLESLFSEAQAQQGQTRPPLYARPDYVVTFFQNYLEALEAAPQVAWQALEKLINSEPHGPENAALLLQAFFGDPDWQKDLATADDGLEKCKSALQQLNFAFRKASDDMKTAALQAPAVLQFRRWLFEKILAHIQTDPAAAWKLWDDFKQPFMLQSLSNEPLFQGRRKELLLKMLPALLDRLPVQTFNNFYNVLNLSALVEDPAFHGQVLNYLRTILEAFKLQADDLQDTPDPALFEHLKNHLFTHPQWNLLWLEWVKKDRKDLLFSICQRLFTHAKAGQKFARTAEVFRLDELLKDSAVQERLQSELRQSKLDWENVAAVATFFSPDLGNYLASNPKDFYPIYRLMLEQAEKNSPPSSDQLFRDYPGLYFLEWHFAAAQVPYERWELLAIEFFSRSFRTRSLHDFEAEINRLMQAVGEEAFFGELRQQYSALDSCTYFKCQEQRRIDFFTPLLQKIASYTLSDQSPNQHLQNLAQPIKNIRKRQGNLKWKDVTDNVLLEKLARQFQTQSNLAVQRLKMIYPTLADVAAEIPHKKNLQDAAFSLLAAGNLAKDDIAVFDLHNYLSDLKANKIEEKLPADCNVQLLLKHLDYRYGNSICDRIEYVLGELKNKWDEDAPLRLKNNFPLYQLALACINKYRYHQHVPVCLRMLEVVERQDSETIHKITEVVLNEPDTSAAKTWSRLVFHIFRQEKSSLRNDYLSRLIRLYKNEWSGHYQAIAKSLCDIVKTTHDVPNKFKSFLELPGLGHQLEWFEAYQKKQKKGANAPEEPGALNKFLNTLTGR